MYNNMCIADVVQETYGRIIIIVFMSVIVYTYNNLSVV